MAELSAIHIAIAYLVIINVVAFFVYGIDKWKAKHAKWRVSEATLLILAIVGGSIGAWFGMKVWHHKTLHKKFRYGIPLIIILQVALFVFTSCRSRVSAISDQVWAYSQSHPDGFTLDIRTMQEPKEGVAVSYEATQGSHSRKQLSRVVKHALGHNGLVGGWLDTADGSYYFDSSRLFPEDSLEAAILFGKSNGQKSVYVLSSGTEIPIHKIAGQIEEHSPSVFLVMYDAEIGKEALLKAIKDYKVEIIYDYRMMNGMALKKPDDKTLEETMAFFRKVKGVLSVEFDHVYHLTDPVKPKLEIK